MATVKTRHSEFTGHVGPVRFDKGTAETDLPTMLLHFRRDPDRYEVSEDEPTEGAPRPGSKAALQAEAEALGLDTSGSKAALSERIKAHQADQDGEDGEDVHDPEPRDGDGDGMVHDGTPDEHPADESPEDDTDE